MERQPFHTQPAVAKIADEIPGYGYGEASPSPTSVDDLSFLKLSAGFTDRDEDALRLAGSVLVGQTAEIVRHWRSGIIASIPHLSRHSRTPEGEAIPAYLERSNLRFEQWILDTCLRPYDQTWLDYQREIALRHMEPKKNQVDGVRSTAFVPFHDIVAFVAVMNETIRPYLAAKGHSEEDVEAMHGAWRKSLQIQIALWSVPYIEGSGDIE